MKSHGTKETQGINGDAAALTATTSSGAPCPYECHRGSDWRLSPEHPPRCGVCHPPAGGLEVERVERRR